MNLNNGMLAAIPDRSELVTDRHLQVLRGRVAQHVPDPDRAVVLDMLGLIPPAVHDGTARTWRHVGCDFCGAVPWADCRGAGKPSRNPHRSRVRAAGQECA